MLKLTAKYFFTIIALLVTHFFIGNLAFFIGVNESLNQNRNSQIIRDIGLLEIYCAAGGGAYGGNKLVKAIDSELGLQFQIHELQSSAVVPKHEEFFVKSIGVLTSNAHQSDYDREALAKYLMSRYKSLKIRIDSMANKVKKDEAEEQ
jgi:hypothetical protein